MPEFAGLSKEDHEKLTRAATMYRNLTGEALDVTSIPVAEPEKDAKERAKREEKAFTERAKATKSAEDAKQKLRQLEIAEQKGASGVQDENPGPGQPAMVTERAKAQGVSRKGEEPESAGGAPGAQNKGPHATDGNALNK